jgi:integrase
MGRPAMSIAANDVIVLMADFDRLDLSQSRKKHIRTAINLVFDWATRERHLPPTIVPPAKGISIGKRLKKRQPILTIMQMRKFLDEAFQIGHEFYELWAVAFLTGMRSGELFALKWSDICHERKVIRVERSYNKRRNVEKSTKSGDWREVPINSEMLGLLERLRIKTGATCYVLPRINAWRRGEASKVTRSFCRAINVPEINFHATRACFAVQMLQINVPVPVVMKIGGWAEFKSFQHYLRLAGVDIQNATEGLRLLPISVEAARPLELRSLG